MTEQELQKLLALKRCETPNEEKLRQVEARVSEILRLEKKRVQLQPTLSTLLATMVFRWMPAFACVLLVVGLIYLALIADFVRPIGNNAAKPTSFASEKALFPNFSPLPAFPTGTPPVSTSDAAVLRPTSFDANPVVFEQTRITY